MAIQKSLTVLAMLDNINQVAVTSTTDFKINLIRLVHDSQLEDDVLPDAKLAHYKSL
jgi:hypothetical protein